jgi:NADPH-dependent 2,4-dienoyl-CoA reductase/sulfur reductase-like enzyme/peroxiredoxin family protein/rhodanese-related sulfurtransferase/TusA-related sulfurtransferase
MRLVVVGGVAAGASVAARARRLDEFAEIIVLERSGNVSFANCGLPYHIGEVIKDRSRLLLQTPESLRDSLDIDVRVSAEVTAIDPAARTVTVRDLLTGEQYTEGWDKLALCPGSSPFRPPLPGLDHPDVMVLRNVEDMDAIKAKVDEIASDPNRLKHAVVIGAGYIGLEMAENLHERGLAVEIVELGDQIMPPLDKELSTPMENYLRAHGIALHLGTAAAAFSPGKAPQTLTVELTSGRFLRTSLVILSAGVRPNVELAAMAGLELGPRGGIKVDRHMRTSHPDIYAAGDAVEVEHTVLPDSWIIPLAGPANRQARVAAENICGRDTTYESTQGTSIVKVFDMVAGGTGATEKQLRAAGIPFLRAHVHPSGHAGYYPGTSQMDVKCLYSPEGGRILGAQITGFDGVDKRLDVFATAIRLGATVFDLEKLELAYAPPFGSAKDPVNMIGFIGSNILNGDLHAWFSTDYPANCEGARIIDVRGPSEYDLWHIPGAENVPLATMRTVSDDWDRDTPIRLYCAVGFRSYLAYRALVQRGFTDVSMLMGGMQTFRAWHHVAPDDVPDPVAPVTSYAEEASLRAAGALPAAPTAGTGVEVDLDCTGLACPGPIMALQTKMGELNPGDEVVAHVSDIGFRLDAPAWAAKNGHEVLDVRPEGAGMVARFRKGGTPAAVGGATANPVAARLKDKKAFVVFSGDFDKVLASFIIANGAAAMGDEVSMFFTFWGLNALRRPDAPDVDKSLVNQAFARMMPAGPDRMRLSQMHMLGGGTAMIKKIMRDNNVPSLPELIESAQKSGVRLVACTMTMDLLGLHEDEMLDGVEFGGVAMFLGEANESNGTFFI